MSKVYDGISAELQAFLARQPMFFVATAPLAADGHVNVSPKGLDGTFVVLGEHRVAYLDLTGSGIETVAHVRENERITLMFCAFDGPARIVRLSGRGGVVTSDEPGFAEVAAPFPTLPGARAVITVEVDRVADSCGYGVPRMALVEQHERLLTSLASKGDDGLAAYRAQRNATSIDGLPGW
jgi:Pyridoxamine 5'-phosphate oxidase